MARASLQQSLLNPVANVKENTEGELLFSVFPRGSQPIDVFRIPRQMKGGYELWNLCFSYRLKTMFFIAFDFVFSCQDFFIKTQSRDWVPKIQ